MQQQQQQQRQQQLYVVFFFQTWIYSELFSVSVFGIRSPSDAMPNENKRIQVPDELREVLLEFSISFLLEQPPDVVDFAVDYFTKLQADRKLTSGQQEGNGEEAKGDSLEEDEEDE
uniref:RIIa domain-containing protein n=1 Tax=Glossina morsitans morsitans TaxID=37546 RepID=A0A1B0FK53_GLOMM